MQDRCSAARPVGATPVLSIPPCRWRSVTLSAYGIGAVVLSCSNSCSHKGGDKPLARTAVRLGGTAS